MIVFKNKKSEFLMISTIILLCALSSAEIDLYIPGFPEIMETFGINVFQVELTLGVNLFSQFIMSFFVGSMGDKYDKKPIILLGLSVFVIGSFVCMISSGLVQLLIGRTLQGIGIAAPAVLTFTIIADSYKLKKQQALMGVLNGVSCAALAAAPIAGSYICKYWHWNGHFAFLTTFGLVCLVLSALFLPKGIKNENKSMSILEYKVIFKSKKLMLYILTVCAMILPYWSFTGISSVLYIKDFGVSLDHFGFYQGVLATIFATASFMLPLLMRRFEKKQLMRFGIVFIIAFIALGIAASAMVLSSPALITAIVSVFALGMIFPVNFLYPAALAVLPEEKGKASAVVGGLKYMLIPLSLQISGHFYNGTIVPIFIVMITIASIGMIMLRKIYVSYEY